MAGFSKLSYPSEQPNWLLLVAAFLGVNQVLQSLWKTNQKSRTVKVHQSPEDSLWNGVINGGSTAVAHYAINKLLEQNSSSLQQIAQPQTSSATSRAVSTFVLKEGAKKESSQIFSTLHKTAENAAYTAWKYLGPSWKSIVGGVGALGLAYFGYRYFFQGSGVHVTNNNNPHFTVNIYNGRNGDPKVTVEES